jgi:hypothetical protein
VEGRGRRSALYSSAPHVVIQRSGGEGAGHRMAQPCRPRAARWSGPCSCRAWHGHGASGPGRFRAGPNLCRARAGPSPFGKLYPLRCRCSSGTPPRHQQRRGIGRQEAIKNSSVAPPLHRHASQAYRKLGGCMYSSASACMLLLTQASKDYPRRNTAPTESHIFVLVDVATRLQRNSTTFRWPTPQHGP